MLLEKFTAADWVEISWLVAHLWLVVAVVLGTAAAYALAHGFIPSLVQTGDIAPEAGRRLRMPLYGIFAMGLILALGILVNATIRALDLLPDLYPRLAI